jgi:hypothetical protein
MKSLLFIAVIIGYSSTGAAQESVTKGLKEKGKLQQFPGVKPTSERNLQAMQPNKLSPGIYKLPQDNMTCIVPDTKDVVAMPNAASQVKIFFKTNIPNGYKSKVGIKDKNGSK